MVAMKQIEQLKQKLTELEKQNSYKHTVFCSLQLVLSELKSENDRLQEERQECTSRLEQMIIAKETITKYHQMNSTLIELLLKKQVSLKKYQNQPSAHSEEIKSHENIQQIMEEKMLQLKGEYEKLPIVNKHKELQLEETALLAKIQQLKTTKNEEETKMTETLNELDQKNFGKIVSILMKNKLLVDSEVKPEEFKSLKVSQVSTRRTQEQTMQTQKIAKMPIKISKLDDLVFPQIPSVSQQVTKNPKIDTQTMLANLRKQIQESLKKFSKESYALPQTSKESVSKASKAISPKLFKTTTPYGSKKRSPETKQHVKPNNKFCEKTKSNMAKNSGTSGLGGESLCETIKQVNSLVANQINKTTPDENLIPKSSSEDKVQNKENKKDSNLLAARALGSAKKVTVLSDIVIKKATSSVNNTVSIARSAKNQNASVNEEKAQAALEVKMSAKDQLKILQEQKFQNDKLPVEIKCRPPTNENDLVSSKNPVQERHLSKEAKLKRKVSQDEITPALKPSPPKIVKGVRVQSFDNGAVDLNTELPSSHITINSSNESTDTAKVTKKPSPSGSLNDFFNDYNFDATSPGNSGKKRKLSPGPTSFESGIDFDNFDFGKQAKIGSDAGSDDFLKMLGTSPQKEADDGDSTSFNFEAFIGF